ncbi:Low molecular weight protein-tyrosine-phosphatase [Candidatus Accumulibacter aalborgensis]|uniref:protein-tyrosine-phosphatase n=2 Tax=Candidatus Accumulibacter aalborgensis TaxID=1860102 RepID=A0A1A8XLJ5_9PROT|nr:Low molecular weight protein-tyrosine-phosphatase [Candidatus Accumulibacter aalborgensis]
MAEAVTRAMAQREGLATMLELDSAGTHGHYHAGEAPDARARRIAATRGYDLSRLRARSVVAADFERFDRILAMDEENLSGLQRICPEASRFKLGLFLDYADGAGIAEVPDPYYGADAGFERVLDLCEQAAEGLLAAYRRGPPSASA